MVTTLSPLLAEVGALGDLHDKGKGDCGLNDEGKGGNSSADSLIHTAQQEEGEMLTEERIIRLYIYIYISLSVHKCVSLLVCLFD